jgi:acyl transferase domain-containing protein
MAVGMGFDKAADFCSQPRFLGRISVAASNAPNSTTLSGHADALAEAKSVLDKDKVFARMLKVDTAYHSPHMQACANPYLASLTVRGIKYSAARRSCTWVSSIHGFEMDSSSDPVSNQYWIENLTNPVLFSDALAQTINDHGPFSLALEVGPHASLKGPTNQMMQHLTQSTIPYCGSLNRGSHDISAFSAALGFVWTTLGPSTVDFPAFTATLGPKGTKKPRMLKGLPSYAWDHDQTFWKESRLSKLYRSQKVPPQELLGSRIDSTNQEFRWRNILRLSEIPWLRDHKFQTETLFPAAGYCSMALEASKVFWQSQAVKLIVLQDLQIHKAIGLEEDSPGVEVLFTLTRRDGPIDRVDAEKQTILAEFICSACNVEGTGSISTIFTGQMQITLGISSTDSLPPRVTKNPDLKPVDLDRFYSCMSDVGLDYTGLFRGLLTAKRRLFESSTLASKPWSSFLVHPALLDMCFQSIFVGYFAPGDE